MTDKTPLRFNRNIRHKGNNIFKTGRNVNKHNDNLTKSERLMEGVGIWTSFYRSNPHRFVEDYFGIKLKVFQQILIMMMMVNNYFMYFASRGQGKTFLTAIYCCVKATLFPNSKIVIAAGLRSQSREVIEKIEEIRHDSPGLKREISDINTGSKDPQVLFHNGSWIKTVAANDGARGKRGNVLIIDEFRMVDFSIISSVLRKFLTAPRNPGYLKKPEYAHLIERNQELYLSSAWYKFHWSYKRMQAYFDSMMEGRKYFVCGLPYQLAIKENLLDRNQIEDEMAESDFNALEFSIEMECLFYGESEKAYYNFEELHKNRKIPRPLYPPNAYDLLRDKKFKPDPKKKDEIRLLSCDIAAMAGKSNDASIFSIVRLIPTANGFTREVSYIESLEGGHTQAQAVRIRQMYDDFEADYIVLDTMGVGLGVYDQLVIPLLDDERGIEYEPISCINDEKMAVRCTYSDAEKVIYSIKGSAQLNSEAAISLKDGLQRGKVRLLVPDNEGRDFLRKIKGFDKLSPEIQTEMELPYAQTTLLVNEMINLEGERNNDTGLIKLKEQRSGRKDRYSSAVYANYIANQLERDMMRGQREDISDYLFFMQSGF